MKRLDELRTPARSSTAIRQRSVAVRVVVVVSALGGALAGAHPTGVGAADVILTALVAGTVTGFASRAKRWTWAAAAGSALVASAQDTALFLLVGIVFGAAVATSALNVRNRVIGALLGAATVQMLLRLPAWGPFGFPALVAAVAMGIVIVSGFANTKRRTRVRVVWATSALLGLALVATALFAVAGLRVRDDLNAGIAATKRGINAASEGDTQTAAAQFDRAHDLLASVSKALDQPWARAAGAVPIVGQHEKALRILTQDATRLTATGARAARDADVETLRVKDGRLDITRVEAMRAPLARVDNALTSAQDHLTAVDSDWLLGPVRDELDQLRSKVDRAAGSARTASVGIDAAPTLLGRDRPARFLLMFTTPSEARSLGFMGNWGILTVDAGKLNLTRFGRTDELNAGGNPSTRKITAPSDYLARYGRYQPEKDWRNVTMSPDFPTVAKVARELAPQSGIGPVDGVIAIDPEGVAALLKLTGPVTVLGRADPLTSDNAADFLLRGQYEQLSNPNRIDYLDEAAHAVTDKLTHSTLPGPRTLGKVLGPAVKRGHILLEASDPTAERLFKRLGASGTLAPSTGDYVGLTTQNASGNKIEVFLRRSLRYDVRVDPSAGEERATAAITLVNNAPTTGEPDYVIGSPVPSLPTGANRSIVSFYTYLTLDRATLDGHAVGFAGQTERGLNVYTTAVTIPSGQTAQLHLELHGGTRLGLLNGGPAIQLTVGHQVMPNPDSVEVRLSTAGGWSLDAKPPLASTGPGTARWRANLLQRTTLDATVSQ